jgi:hypothetical protein
MYQIRKILYNKVVDIELHLNKINLINVKREDLIDSNKLLDEFANFVLYSINNNKNINMGHARYLKIKGYDISYIKKKLKITNKQCKEYLNNELFCKDFEYFCLNNIILSKDLLKSNESFTNIIYGTKFINTKENFIHLKQEIDFKVEYENIRKNRNKTHYYVILCNPEWKNDALKLVKIDPLNDANDIVINKYNNNFQFIKVKDNEKNQNNINL